MNRLHEDRLREANISPSYTRVLIFDYLKTNHNHPNVDEIYKALSKKLPTLSKTTVYNVLKLFIEKDIARKVTISSSEDKYELAYEDHSHFKCEICNKLYDIPLVKTEYNIETLEGFKVNNKEVLLSGICKNCHEKH